jgi:putative ABC transport system substrate-binding protein
MNRRDALMSLFALGTTPLAASAQQTRKAVRIGILRAAPDDVVFRQNFEPFLSTLRERGFTVGSNLTVNYRVAPGKPGEVLSSANELVGAKVDAILAIAAPGVTAASKATTSIPIVAVDLESDPVASGFAANLARPGGNITGLFLDFPELSGKWIQLLKEAMPKLGRVAVLWDPAIGQYLLKGADQAGASMRLQIARLEARGPAELTRAFESAEKLKVEAILVLSSPAFNSARKEIAELAVKHRLPVIMPFPNFADDGGLMAYGPHLTSMFRQAGEVMAKVLQGIRPGEIPIERPTRFELAINLKTAGVLGITIPPSLLVRADRVIK